MQYRDYYKILGVERSADEAQIKRAYRKLARKYHPDVSKDPDAENRFKELGEAYAVLKDADKRAAYDQLGSEWKSGQDFQPPPDWGSGFEFHGRGGGQSSFDQSSFFESLFGQGPGSPFSGATSSPPPADHHAKILIDLEDTWAGASRQFTLRLPEHDANGQLRIRDRTIRVKIPRGIRPGQHIRLKGLAGSATGKPGDLYLEVEIKPHKRFRLVDSDLYIDVPLAPWEAALGAKVRLPSPSGVVELSIPPNTPGGSKLRLKGKGMPGETPGHLYAVIEIKTPPANSEEDKEKYLSMKAHFDFNPRQHFDG